MGIIERLKKGFRGKTYEELLRERNLLEKKLEKKKKREKEQQRIERLKRQLGEDGTLGKIKQKITKYEIDYEKL